MDMMETQIWIPTIRALLDFIVQSFKVNILNETDNPPPNFKELDYKLRFYTKLRVVVKQAKVGVSDLTYLFGMYWRWQELKQWRSNYHKAYGLSCADSIWDSDSWLIASPLCRMWKTLKRFES